SLAEPGADDRPNRIAFMVDNAGRVDDLDRLGIEELESHRGNVDGVAGHVPQSTRPKVEPPPPVKRLVSGMVRPVGGGTQELVPAQLVRDPRHSLGPMNALRPDRSIGPDVDVLDGTQNSGPNQL